MFLVRCPITLSVGGQLGNGVRAGLTADTRKPCRRIATAGWIVTGATGGHAFPTDATAIDLLSSGEVRIATFGLIHFGRQRGIVRGQIGHILVGLGDELTRHQEHRAFTGFDHL